MKRLSDIVGGNKILWRILNHVQQTKGYEKYYIPTAGCTVREILEQAHGVVYKKYQIIEIGENCHCLLSGDIGAYNPYLCFLDSTMLFLDS